jgi:guanylate kinase
MVYEGKYYGTLKGELERIWQAGKTPLLDIEVKGAIHLQEQYPHSTLSIFIEPPSVEELRRRLEMRGTETAESLRDRVNKASYELSFKHHFDRIILNSELEKACQEADEAIKSFLGL